MVENGSDKISVLEINLLYHDGDIWKDYDRIDSYSYMVKVNVYGDIDEYYLDEIETSVCWQDIHELFKSFIEALEIELNTIVIDNLKETFDLFREAHYNYRKD